MKLIKFMKFIDREKKLFNINCLVGLIAISNYLNCINVIILSLSELQIVNVDIYIFVKRFMCSLNVCLFYSVK